MPFNFRKVDELISSEHIKMSDIFEKFKNKFMLTHFLLLESNKKIKSKEIIQETRKLCIINYVTAYEVYLREMFIFLIDKENININYLILEYNKLKKQKFDLEDLIKIINEKDKYTLGRIIASVINFQNLHSIENAYSNLLKEYINKGNNFFDEIKNYEIRFLKRGKTVIKLDEDCNAKLARLLHLRHDFVHHSNFDFKIKATEINQLSNNLFSFIAIIDYYLKTKKLIV